MFYSLMMSESSIEIPLIFLFVLSQILFPLNCTSEMCNYIVRKSDNSTERCSMNECSKYLDILSIMVEPKYCKTSLLILSFSSYDNFVLFRDELKWKISDLFSSEKLNGDRQLKLYLNKLNSNSRPFDHHQLIQLGNNIDHYILFIKFIEDQHSFNGLIHHDPNDPQWNIIQIKFRCSPLSSFDEFSCSSQIIPSRIFHSQQSFSSRIQLITNNTEQINNSFPFQDKSTKISNKRQTKSIYLILIIIISLIVLFIGILLIFLWIKKKCFTNKEINSISQTTIQNHPINNRTISISTISDNTILPQESSNTINYSRPCTTNRSRRNLENNYEKVNIDTISLVGQQHFVPISTSIHF